VELLPHQVVAVDEARARRKDYPNFFLGDSMGVGKTASAIGIDLDLRREHGSAHFRTLIICQKSGLAVWKYHLEAMGVASDQILVINPGNRTPFNDELACGAVNYQYYIVHWDVLIRLPDLLPPKPWQKGIIWDHIIADEIHLAKNRKAKRTVTFKRIKGRFKTAASGTPADDKPQDIWSPLNWLYPKEFSAYWRYYNTYLDWETHPNGYRIIKGTKNVARLHAQIRPFYIRRTLLEVVDSMPDKTHTELRVQLTPRQRRDYDAMEKYQVAALGDNYEEFVVTWKIAMYMRLLQMTLGTCEVDWTAYNAFWEKWNGTPQDKLPLSVPTGPKILIREPSPKLDVLMEQIEDHEDEQFVVFTNFRAVVEMVQARCQTAGISTSILTGGITSQPRRDAAVADFQSGRSRVFIGTVGAAGTTITLTAAHTLVFTDRNWNPSKNAQAEDRIWRIGQKNACQIIDIIAEDTVDEPRLRRIWEKARNVDEIVNIKPLRKQLTSSVE
jgi:SNF2 family DNA or RNA helicase